MTASTPHAIELLRDEKGVYGLGVNELYQERAPSEIILPWATANSRIVVRPGKLENYDDDPLYHSAALQPIFGGYRRSIFHQCKEEMFRKLIHYRMLNRAGLPWPASTPWWSDDAAQRAINRGKYHGFRVASVKIINTLIREALASADEDALRQARRFPLCRRYQLYVAGAAHVRNLQLIEAFPALALTVFTSAWIPDESGINVFSKEYRVRRQEARQMILRGEPLRKIADLMGVPWVLKCAKPGAAQELCH